VAQLITLYWRDIPAQVIAERGRGRKREQAKIELHRRFAIAIDAAAMRDGADSTDDYLAEWRRGAPVECGEDLEAEAATQAAALEAEYPAARVKALVENGGVESA
jgi:hypothetical protein